MYSSAEDIRRVWRRSKWVCGSIRPLFFSLICVFSVLSTPCSTKWTLWPPVIFQPFDEGHWSTNKGSQWSAVYAEGPASGPISPPLPRSAAGYVGTLMTGHSAREAKPPPAAPPAIAAQTANSVPLISPFSFAPFSCQSPVPLLGTRCQSRKWDRSR